MPESRRLTKVGLVIVAVAAVVAAGLWIRTGPDETLVTVTSHPLAVMATSSTLTVVVPQGEEAAAQKALAKAEATLRRVEALMSAYRDDSEVRRLNHAPARERVTLSPETVEVLRAARRFTELTGGAFDVTAGALFRLWRRCAGEGRLPKREELAAARAASGWTVLELLDDGAVKADELARVDLGGIAKGYAIDRAIEAMKAAGCVGGLVDVGGDIRCFGAKPGGRPWRIAVRAPAGSPHAGVLEIGPAAVCTSGDYLRFVEIEGKRYGHIIDPRSGMPVEATPSVTVIAPDASTADSLATAISVLGPTEGLELAATLEGVECLLMVREQGGEVLLHRSEGFPDLIEGPSPRAAPGG